MALNMCEIWFKGIKKALFPKKLWKIAQQLGASPPDPQSLRPLGAPPPDLPSEIRLSYTGFLKTSPKSKSPNFWWRHCMWFVVKASPIKNSGYSYKLEIAWKTFLKTFFFFFFFLESTCACVLGPWPRPRAFLSLASRVSVLGKAVLGLGLGFFLCPWPWPRIFFVSLALASSLVSSTPPLVIIPFSIIGCCLVIEWCSKNSILSKLKRGETAPLAPP